VWDVKGKKKGLYKVVKVRRGEGWEGKVRRGLEMRKGSKRE
jgi:hypothetical protein